jgi:hypothetical protein
MRNLQTIRIALIMALSVVALTVCAQVIIGAKWKRNEKICSENNKRTPKAQYTGGI